MNQGAFLPQSPYGAISNRKEILISAQMSPSFQVTGKQQVIDNSETQLRFDDG